MSVTKSKSTVTVRSVNIRGVNRDLVVPHVLGNCLLSVRPEWFSYFSPDASCLRLVSGLGSEEFDFYETTLGVGKPCSEPRRHYLTAEDQTRTLLSDTSKVLKSWVIDFPYENGEEDERERASFLFSFVFNSSTVGLVTLMGLIPLSTKLKKYGRTVS